MGAVVADIVIDKTSNTNSEDKNLKIKGAEISAPFLYSSHSFILVTNYFYIFSH